MSNLQASCARSGTGKSNPADVLNNRSSRIMEMTLRQEKRYVDQWMHRINAEARLWRQHLAQEKLEKCAAHRSGGCRTSGGCELTWAWRPKHEQKQYCPPAFFP
mmetsp:Transcript_74965/g.208427  ORF Transcript_74965/g.208427 Transcript_74965/m.208427 type:complete len:104 (+) Transcript_74965:42-353(+)